MRERGLSEPAWSLGAQGPHVGRQWLASTQRGRPSRSGCGVSDRPPGDTWAHHVGEQLTARGGSWVSAVNIPFPGQSWLPPRQGSKMGLLLQKGGPRLGRLPSRRVSALGRGIVSPDSPSLGGASRAQDWEGRAQLSHGPRREAPIPPLAAGLLLKVPERRLLSPSTGTV